MFKKSILLNFRNFFLEFWSVGNTVCFGSIDKRWSSFDSIWKLSNHIINYNKTDEFNWTGCYGTLTTSGVHFIFWHKYGIQNASSELFWHFLENFCQKILSQNPIDPRFEILWNDRKINLVSKKAPFRAFIILNIVFNIIYYYGISKLTVYYDPNT